MLYLGVLDNKPNYKLVSFVYFLTNQLFKFFLLANKHNPKSLANLTKTGYLGVELGPLVER